jgi:hypothetical protein
LRQIDEEAAEKSCSTPKNNEKVESNGGDYQSQNLEDNVEDEDREEMMLPPTMDLQNVDSPPINTFTI